MISVHNSCLVRLFSCDFQEDGQLLHSQEDWIVIDEAIEVCQTLKQRCPRPAICATKPVGIPPVHRVLWAAC